MSPCTAFGGYRATQTDGELVVHDVPIFCACERDGIEFDDKWIARAVKEAKLAESEGYLPPMHTRHHEPGVEPRAAGVFRITGVGKISMKGKPRTAVMADLIFRDPETIVEVLARRYPYRSVEIFDVNKPGLNGLALLDHEAPFLELPMLMVSQVEERQAGVGSFAADWQMNTVRDGSVMALFRRGATAHVLFRNEEGTMPDEKKEQDEDAMYMESDSDTSEDRDDGENMQEDGVDVVAQTVSMIEDGSIPIAGFDSIKAAMDARLASTAEPEAEEEVDEDELVAPATLPSRDAMKARPSMDSQKFAQMQGRIDALEAAHREYAKREKQRQAVETRKTDVAAAMKRLERRPLGDLEKLEAKLVNFHKDHGPKAFAAYVESMEDAVPEWTGDPVERPLKMPTNRPASPVAMRYQTLGADAVEKAMNFSREWRELKETGHTRRSEDQYVEANMRRLGLASVATKNGAVNHG